MPKQKQPKKPIKTDPKPEIKTVDNIIVFF